MEYSWFFSQQSTAVLNGDHRRKLCAPWKQVLPNHKQWKKMAKQKKSRSVKNSNHSHTHCPGQTVNQYFIVKTRWYTYVVESWEVFFFFFQFTSYPAMQGEGGGGDEWARTLSYPYRTPLDRVQRTWL